MSLTTCTIHATQKPEKVVYISGELGKALQIAKTKRISISIGRKSAFIPVRWIKKGGNHLYLPSSVMNTLKLPHIGSCLITASDKELRLGPLIGILTNLSSHGTSTSPFGSRTSFIKQLIQIGAKKSFFIVFSPKDVNWQQETINGYMLQSDGGWVRKTVPLPDVVYNRLTSRKAEKQVYTEDFKQHFVSRKIPFFNWSFFDKSDVYKLLENDEASQYVPESVMNPSADQLNEMLDKHKFIYLKPTAGSLGIGIYRITYSPQRGYFVRYRQDGKNVLLRFKKFENLVKMLGVNKGRLNRYVAQQGIRLIEIDNCPIDFRFHMNKNGSNHWVVSAIGAKKAGKGSVTTHVRNGGQLMTAEQVMRQVYGNRGDQILQYARDTAVRIANSLEKSYDHLLGELGFDIGIDQNERIWMFEANAKPGRSIFKHPHLKKEEQDTLTNVYDYSLYLSRFRARRDG
ncbi:YheC/YheD family protein [Paenibacillus larvae]